LGIVFTICAFSKQRVKKAAILCLFDTDPLEGKIQALEKNKQKQRVTRPQTPVAGLNKILPVQTLLTL